MVHLDDLYNEIHKSQYSTDQLVEQAIHDASWFLSADGEQGAREFLNGLDEEERRLMAADALVSVGVDISKVHEHNAGR